MDTTSEVDKILSYYESDSPEVKQSLARILMHGKLAGTGKLVILPVDQGFEHGPARSFASNPPAYDPHYHYQLAIDAGLSAYAAPLGMLEAGAQTFKGKIPTILKLNSSNALARSDNSPSQAITGSVKDAVRLGCAAIGYTIYPGSDAVFGMIEKFQRIAEEAKEAGLAVVLWSYPRGGELGEKGATALDICAYAAHMAALLGAHIIKVKLPTEHLQNSEAKKVYEEYNIPHGFVNGFPLKSDGIPSASMHLRVKHVVQSCFNGRRLVVFSGGATKNDRDLIAEVHAINIGGGSGSIIGRNAFQRPKNNAVELLTEIINIYKPS